MVREYFKQLNLDKLPSKVSNYISQEILTDLGLDLLSEDDELFKKVKNKIDSILQKEVMPSEGAFDRFAEKMDKIEDENESEKASWEGLKELAQAMIKVSKGEEKDEWIEAERLAELMLAD